MRDAHKIQHMIEQAALDVKNVSAALYQIAYSNNLTFQTKVVEYLQVKVTANVRLE